MYEEQENCTLTCDGEEVAMKSVHVHGKLDGLLLRMKVRQTYTNESEDNLETVYTFPLAWGATLLNLAVELNGKRLNGTVIEKKQAVKQYEEAIDKGDSPIMVERSGRGLYTANLGNLLPGETAVIEIEYAQLLNFEVDRIRLNVPTTIAPRYGDQHAQGGLPSHQTTAANGLVEYGFFMTLDIHGTAAKGLVSSPTHPIKTTKSFDGINVQLGKQAYLDRDFVLLIEDLKGESFCIAGPDSEGSNTTAIITSFCPQLPTVKPSNLRLKVLLDCSGSMGGDSMVQARVALKHLFKQLNEEDSFAYTRFGSSIDRVTPKMTMAYSERIQTLLRTIDKTEADLGGTELDKAITDVFNMNANGKPRNSTETTDSADVLLITDGEVWNIENILASARISGHRVYTIGVGSAPAESLLRELAKDTGGSCEFVTPREDMRSAVDRMVTRMRSAQEVRFAIKWNATEEKHKNHEWASTLPPQLIDGETVHLFARLPAKTEKPPVLICKTLVNEVEQEVSSAKPANITWDTEGIVARLCAAAQIGELTENKADSRLAQSLAMKYQLVTQHTNLFLVHERAEESKAEGLPTLQQVAQMQAAGFGGYGSVHRAAPDLSVMRMSCHSESFAISDSLSASALGGDYGRLNTPSVWRTNRTQAASKVDGMASAGMDDIEIPAFLRKQVDSDNELAQSSTTAPDAVGYASSSNHSLLSHLSSKIKEFISPATPPQQRVLTDEEWPEEPTPSEASKVDIALALNTAALHASSFRIALQHTLKLNMPSNYASVIIDLTKVTKDSATSWALLLEWLFGDIEKSGLLDRHAQRLLRSQLKLATDDMREHAQVLIESNLIIVN
jgi:Ca-activated chloride channel family protein